MRAIAAKVGYVPGTVYNAIGDLDAVLLRVNAMTLEEMGNRLAPIAAGGASPMDAALGLADAYLDFVAENPRLWEMLLERQPPAEPPIDYDRARARLVNIVETVLAPLFTDLGTRRRAVIALWAALQGLAGLAAGGNLAFAMSASEIRWIARGLVQRYLTGTETLHVA
jgi:AcrR family transcriptional regulator